MSDAWTGFIIFSLTVSVFFLGVFLPVALYLKRPRCPVCGKKAREKRDPDSLWTYQAYITVCSVHGKVGERFEAFGEPDGSFEV